MFFSKRKTEQEDQLEDVCESDETTATYEATPIEKKGFWQTGAGKVVDRVGEKLQRAKQKWDKISMILTVVSVVFFTLFALVSIWKDWSDSKLFPVIIAGTALYVIAFVAYNVVTTRRDKNVKNGLRNFKSNMKYWKLAMNLLFLLLNVLVFANSWQNYRLADGILPVLTMLASATLMIINLFVTVVKLIVHSIFDKMRRNRAKKKMQKNGK